MKKELWLNIKEVIVNPRDAFEDISERGYLWPSIIVCLLAEVPNTLFMTGLMQFSLYRLILFLLAPLWLVILTGLIHIACARFSKVGSWRSIFAVWGFTSIPILFAATISLILSTCSMPTFVSILFVLVVLAFFIWWLILIILAIKIVYQLNVRRLLGVLILSFIGIILVSSLITSFARSFLVSEEYGGGRIAMLNEGVMKPNLTINHDFCIDRISYPFRELKRGEIVAFVSDQDKVYRFGISMGMALHFDFGFGPKEYVGRIVGLPAEVVEVKQGIVFVNGRLLEEPYIKLRGEMNYSEIRIPPDHFFVIGDNREIEIATPFGIVALKQIRGRVFDILPPPQWVLELLE